MLLFIKLKVLTENLVFFFFLDFNDLFKKKIKKNYVDLNVLFLP